MHAWANDAAVALYMYRVFYRCIHILTRCCGCEEGSCTVHNNTRSKPSVCTQRRAQRRSRREPRDAHVGRCGVRELERWARPQPDSMYGSHGSAEADGAHRLAPTVTCSRPRYLTLPWWPRRAAKAKLRPSSAWRRKASAKPEQCAAATSGRIRLGGADSLHEDELQLEPRHLRVRAVGEVDDRAARPRRPGRLGRARPAHSNDFRPTCDSASRCAPHRPPRRHGIWKAIWNGLSVGQMGAAGTCSACRRGLTDVCWRRRADKQCL